MRLWDRLISQAEITLNLLRQSRANPKILVQEAINGKFDFNATPMAPQDAKSLSMKIQAKATQRILPGASNRTLLLFPDIHPKNAVGTNIP
jgi:hypothetical protein